MLKMAVVQMEVRAGQPVLNLARILGYIKSARRDGIKVVIFPEMALPGYLLGDEWENEGLIRDLMGKNEQIREASGGMVVIWGSVYADWSKMGDDGRARKYNSVFIVQDGKWVNNGVFEGRSYKTLLPKYREFDDERHFYSMMRLSMERGVQLTSLLQPFEVEIDGRKLKLGLSLCEDMWWEDYGVNPTEILVQNGAEIIVNISCSPWTWRKNDKRHRVIRSILDDSPVPFIYCNNIGVQNNGKNIFLFDGNSTVYNKKGEICALAEDYTEEMLTVDIDSMKVKKGDETLSDQRDVKELYEGLVFGIKAVFDQLDKEKVVIGLSGGIDSAVTACLFSTALGKKNVYGVNMPSRFNSELTKSAAKQLADNLGINYAVVPIEESVQLTKAQLEKVGFGGKVDGYVMENVQARDRGSRVLAGIAASIGAVFSNNGNKTETALGYATLYGDVDGAIAPIADLYKGEVYQLARYINSVDRLIPDEIINVVPSAELSEEQDVTKGKGDPILYPYHDKLIRAFVEFRKDPEDILRAYQDGSLESELKIETGLISKYFKTADEFIDDLEGKWKLYKINYFKRVQAPPIITVSRRAFGFDLRESQNGVYFTEEYLKTRNKLINK